MLFITSSAVSSGAFGTSQWVMSYCILAPGRGHLRRAENKHLVYREFQSTCGDDRESDQQWEIIFFV